MSVPMRLADILPAYMRSSGAIRGGADGVNPTNLRHDALTDPGDEALANPGDDAPSITGGGGSAIPVN